MTPAQLQLLKHAQNEIISLCGGLDAVAARVNYGRSTVGRWSDVGNPSLMPYPAVVVLEAIEGVPPVMTAAMAAIAGGRFLPDSADAGQKSVMAAFAETFVASGELTGAFAAAISDGKLTPTEISGLDQLLADLIRKMTAGRTSLAEARAAGGLKVAS
jgi:hypothetical protein